MSLKGKTRTCLLVFFCSAGLAAAFNSERKSSGDDVSTVNHSQLYNNQYEETKDALIVPAMPEETTQKKNTRIRRVRQRHERNRREKEDEETMREIFSPLQRDPNSIPNSVGYDSNGNSPSGHSSNIAFSSSSNGYIPSGYSYEPPSHPLILPQPTYFQSPPSYAGPQYLPSAAPSHNTIIPNGNQVNNYYPSQFPTYTPASNPWSGVQNNFPAPFYYGPFLIIPIPICYPNNNINNVNNQPEIIAPSPQATPVTLGNRIGEISTPRPPFDFDKYYNTLTGVDLKPVPPGRQPSVTPPPALHLSGENNNQGAQQSRPQPQPQQPRPQPQPQQSRPQQSRPQQQQPAPQRPIQQRPPQQLRPAQPRPQPIPQSPPVGALRPRPTQRPPLRPIVAEPPQELDAPGSEPSQGDSCVWAIVRCCNQVPRPVSVPRCFELFGCPGAFFDNPCDSNIAQSISRAANEIQENGLLFS